jgi:branched-chain amino acid transport system ATP-binding protein
MPELLEVAGVTAGYGDLMVVRDVSFTVAESSVTVLLGPNGAGKTTLLRAVAGLGRVAAGDVTFGGRSLLRQPAYRRCRSGLGLVQENKRVFRKRTVEENLRLGAHGLGLRRPEVAERVEQAYARFPVLADKRQQVAGLLSGGQQQMLAISQALIGRPRLLLLDEPFSGLAPAIVNEVMETVARIRTEDGCTLLIVEQAVDLALTMADSVVLLNLGRVAHIGPADEPGLRARVEGAYFSAAETVDHPAS